MPDQPLQFFDSLLVLMNRRLLGEDLRPFLQKILFPVGDGHGMDTVGSGHLTDGLRSPERFQDHLELEPGRVPFARLLRHHQRLLQKACPRW